MAQTLIENLLEREAVGAKAEPLLMALLSPVHLLIFWLMAAQQAGSQGSRPPPSSSAAIILRQGHELVRPQLMPADQQYQLFQCEDQDTKTAAKTVNFLLI